MKTLSEAVEEGIKVGDIIQYDGKPYIFVGYDNNYPIGYRVIPIEDSTINKQQTKNNGE